MSCPLFPFLSPWAPKVPSVATQPPSRAFHPEMASANEDGLGFCPFPTAPLFFEDSADSGGTLKVPT